MDGLAWLVPGPFVAGRLERVWQAPPGAILDSLGGSVGPPRPVAQATRPLLPRLGAGEAQRALDAGLLAGAGRRDGERWILRAVLPAAACITLLSTSVLLLWLHRLLAGRRPKLMLRQLWHMASADAVAALFFLLWLVAAWLATSMPAEEPRFFILRAETACAGLRWVSRSGHQMSRLMEAHIALASLASTCRQTRALACLERAIPAMWAAAVALAGWIVVFHGGHWDPERACSWQDDSGATHTAWTICICFLICVLSYAFGHARGRTSALARQRALDFTRLYLFAAILTYAPYVLWAAVHIEDPDVNRVCLAVAWTCLELQGAMNTAVYIAQNRQLRRLARGAALEQAAGARSDPPLEAALSESTGRAGDQGAPAPTPLLRCRQASFVVGFVSEPTIIPVACPASSNGSLLSLAEGLSSSSGSSSGSSGGSSSSGAIAVVADAPVAQAVPAASADQDPGARADVLTAMQDAYAQERDSVDDQGSSEEEEVEAEPGPPEWRRRADRHSRRRAHTRAVLAAYQREQDRSRTRCCRVQ